MFDDALEPMQQLVKQIWSLAPMVASILFVLVAGLILSSLAGRSTRFLVRRVGLEALAERFGIAKLLYALGSQQGLAHLLGKLVWFAGLLITLSSAAELMGMPGIAELTTTLVTLLPRLILAAALAGVGFVLADLLRAAIRRSKRQDGGLDSPDLVAQVVYYAVLVLFLTLALEQAGVETGLINALVQITVAAGALSAGLAFAISSRTALENLIARFYYERMIRPGDRIRLGETEGTVVRYGAVAVVVRTKSGERLAIPCSKLIEAEVGFEPEPRGSATSQ